MGSSLRRAVWFALACALTCASGCLDLGDTASDGKNHTSDSGANDLDGAAGWPGTECDGGQKPCSGKCADVTGDPLNCGACGKVCSEPTATCFEGACVCNLDAICSDKCVSLTSNKSHCGACDNKCAAGENCHGGQCCTGC